MSLAQVLSVLASQDDEGNSLARRLAYTNTGPTLDIDPLPSAQRKGLIAVTVMAFLSFIATLLLLLFITYRLVFWRSNYARYIGYNQYIVLIYNLVLADLQQSLAFLICLKWITENKIEASSAACFLQGFWLQIGDPGSGLFVLAIAVHTFLLVALGHKLSHRAFVCGVVGVWLFVAILVIIPLASHGRFVFIPSGAWCWISEEYEPIRLWTHYIWIFLAEFGTVCLYAIMWFQLRRRIKQSAILGNSQTESLKRLRRVIGYMIIYPVAYIVLSLPLAAGRMATAQGQTPSIAFFCVAGAVITSSGLVDVLLYTLTRRNLILESEPSRDRKGKHTRTDISVLRTHRHRGDDDEFGHTVREGSTDNIVQPSGMELAPLGKVYQHTTIEITHEPAYPEAESSDRSSKGSIGNGKGPEQSARMWGR
ncbi:integral membrane protein [Aspergillus arachidicola]|uniref:Integral membrane protein n=1 Tax=Aspergillus arachidicola TaxID=656916 RepID=A0A2G7FJQ5_9EURO|nr:integral membrane protein [Aspergillus arachidicola]